jgi:hypothetical protein
MSTKYVLNQLPTSLSNKENEYITKKFKKYTKNVKLQNSIKNSIIKPISSEMKIPLTKKPLFNSFSRKRKNQLKDILKQQLQSHKDILQSNRDKIIQNITKQKSVKKPNFVQLLRFFGGSKKIKNKK